MLYETAENFKRKIRPERTDKVSPEEVLSQCVLLSLSPDALCLTSLSVLSQSPLSPQTPFLPPPPLPLQQESEASGGWGLPFTERGTPCTACKSPLPIHTHIHTYKGILCLPAWLFTRHSLVIRQIKAQPQEVKGP